MSFRTMTLCATFHFASLPLAIAGAEGQDSTNGFFDPGSYVGSDHWFSSFTQSVLLRAAREGCKEGKREKPSGPLADVAREDAEKGYFRIPCPGGPGGGGQEEVWVRPAPDSCWRRPRVPPCSGPHSGETGRPGGGPGQKPPGKKGGTQPPAGGPGYKSPRSGGGYSVPPSDGGYKPPVSDGNYKPPVSDGDFKRPQSDGGYQPPRSDGGTSAPSPEAGKHCPPSPPGSGATPPLEEEEVEDDEPDDEEEESWEEEEVDEEEPELPEGNSEYRSPKSDGDYKRPGAGAYRAGSAALTPAAARPDSFVAAARRGHRAVLEKDLPGAIREYSAAVRLAGKKSSKAKTEVRFALGAALLAQRQVCKAADHLRLVLKQRPSHSTGRLLYGLALLFKGELGAARDELAKCSGKKTEGLSDLLEGVAADAGGDPEGAVKAYRCSLKRIDSPEVRRRSQDLRAGVQKAAPGKEREKEKVKEPGRAEVRLQGPWRVHSSRLFYDQGGAGSLGGQVFQQLVLEAGGTWRFGSSRGRWSVSPIEASDWKRWGVESYGPSRKIRLSGWNGADASGPLEGSSGKVDFLWVIYRAQPPAASAPGTVHMKFGRAEPR